MTSEKSVFTNFYEKILISNEIINDYCGFTGKMYHYTSPQGIDSILFRDRDIIKLWASRYDSLNDVSEGSVAGEIYGKVCNELLAQGKINKEQFDFFSSIYPEKDKYAFSYASDGMGMSHHNHENYIISFSKSNDLLSMWNYYTKGSNYEGYNVAFDSKNVVDIKKCFSVENNNFRIAKVIYDESTQRELMGKIILNFVDNYESYIENKFEKYLSSYLGVLNMLFKKECFKHEEEVRVVVKMLTDEYVGKSPLEIKYRFKHGYTIPYIELELKKDCVNGVTIGPLLITEEQKILQKEILEYRLKTNAYNNQIVTISEIPVRY